VDSAKPRSRRFGRDSKRTIPSTGIRRKKGTFWQKLRGIGRRRQFRHSGAAVTEISGGGRSGR